MISYLQYIASFVPAIPPSHADRYYNTSATKKSPSFILLTNAFSWQAEIPGKVKTLTTVGGAARILTYARRTDMLIGVIDMNKNHVAAAVNAEHFATACAPFSVGSIYTVIFQLQLNSSLRLP